MIARLSGPTARGLALALVVTVVAPSLGLVPSGTDSLPGAHAAVLPADVCLAVSNGTDQLVQFDRTTTTVTVIGPLGATDVAAAAIEPGTGDLYGVDTDQLGTIDTTTGAFTARPASLTPASDVDSLAFHPFTGALYGIDRAGGKDDLYVIDPATGAVTSGPLDLDPTNAVPTVNAFEDLAISPIDGTAYAIGENGANQRLVEVDLALGTLTDLGVVQDAATTVISDIRGLSFAADGTLLASTGSGSSVPNALFELTPTAGGATPSTATLVGPFGVGSDYGALACLTGAANTVGGTLFQDLDGDGTLDAGEPTRDGVLVTLRRADGTVVDTATTAGGGTYDFTLVATGSFEVVLDTTDPSFTGEDVTPDDVVTVDFGTSLGDTRTVDFWYRQARIAGTAWLDVDHDGIREAGEIAIADGDVQVALWRESNATAGLQTTGTPDTLVVAMAPVAGDGTYAFEDLAADTYYVEAEPGARTFTLQDVGGDDDLDSDVDPTTGTSGPVSLVTGDGATVDIGVWEPGTISGEVWEDVDGDAVREPGAGEALTAGTTVELYAASASTVVVDSVASADGTYAFSGLDAGDYEVRFVPPSGSALTATSADSDPDPATGRAVVTLLPGSDATGVDAGVFVLSSLGDLVFDDTDGDGLQDATEPGIAGVTVRLHDPGDLTAGAALATTVTGAGGAYAFTGLAPGDVVLVFETPTGTVPTVADQGGDDGVDSDVTDGATVPATAVTGTVAVTSGTDDTTVDAGFYVPAGVSGRLFDDQDGDGIDDGEPGWAGVTVDLSADHDGDGTYAPLTSTTTAADGSWAFSGLRPGDHRITVDTSDPTLDDTVLTTANQPLDVTLASGDDLTGQDIGYRHPGAISGLIFEDVAGDGDPTGDPPMVGVEVELRLADGTLLAADTTDAAGRYAFDLLVPGTYEVHVTEPPRFVVTAGQDPTSVVVVPGSSQTVDVGFQAYAPAVTIGPDGAQTVEVGPTSPVDAVYAHTVTNDGNVTDTYDLTASGATWPTAFVRDDDGDGVLDAGETTVVADTGSLTPGASFDLLVVVSVPAGTARGATDTVVVTATSQVGPADPTDPPIDDTVTDVTTVVAPVLSISKTSSLGGAFATPGDRVTYTVVVSSLTPDAAVTTARDVSLEDVLADPSHGTFDASSVTVDGVPQPDPTTFPLALGDLAPGTSVTVTVDVTLARPLADGTTVTDVATATVSNPQLYDGAGTAVGSVTDSVTETIVSSAIPLMTVSATPPAGSLIEPGDVITYRVTVTDRADATDSWRGVELVLDLPATDVAYVPGSATVGGVSIADGAGGTNPFDPSGPGVALGDVAPGVGVIVALQVQVDDPATDGTALTAVAQATGTNAGPLLDGVTHAVDVQAAVALTPDGAATVEPDVQVVHAHLLTNTGNVTDAYDLVADSDAGFSVRVVHDVDGDGALDAGEPTVTGSQDLAPGTFQRLLVVVDVPAGVPGGTVDTTTVVATSRIDPVVLAEAFDVTTVVAGELELVKTATPSSSAVNPGQVLTYRIEARNTGGAAVPGVSVVDDVPSNATYRRGTTRLDGVPVADRAGGDRNPLDSDVGGLALGDLAPGATRVITFEVAIGDPVPDRTLLVNVATATSADGKTATDSVSQLVTASPVIEISKDATTAPGPVAPGTVLTYRIGVRNVGNAPATGVRVEDAVPTNTTYVPGSTTLDGVGVSDAGGAVRSPLAPENGGVAVGRLDPGSAVRTVRFQVRVGDPLPQGLVLTNVARAVTAEGVSANSIAVRHTVEVSAGVDLAPEHDATLEAPGQAVHAHVVTNSGTGTDTIVLSADSSQSWTVTLYRDDDQDGVWDLDEGTVVSSTGPLPPGGKFRFFAVVDVPDATPVGTVEVTTLRATSSADATVSDTAIDTATVIAPELGFVKSADPSGDQVNPGTTITYRLVVTNRGRAAARDVLVVDDGAPGTTYVPGSARVDTTSVPDGVSGDGNPFSTANGGHALASVAAGTTVTLSFAALVPLAAAPGTVITNEATLSVPDTPDVTVQRTHTVTLGPVLDLTKVSEPAETTSLTAGDLVTYALSVRNVGAATATGVRVTDDTPLNTSYVPGSATVDGVGIPDGAIDPNPFASANAGGYAVGDLLPGSDAIVLAFDVEVIDSVDDADTVTNVATASSVEGSSASSPEVRHAVDVMPGATLVPDRDVTATPGTQAIFAHVLTNTGDVPDSYDLSVTSSRGWQVRIHEDVAGDGVIDPGDPELTTTGLLATGSSLRLLVSVDVPATATAGAQDSVTVRARSVEDPSVSATATDTVDVVAGALAFAKTATPATLAPGASSTYTLTVTNEGSAPITGVRVFDTAPAGTTYVAGSTRVDGAAVADTAGGNPLAPGLAVGDLAPDSWVVVTFEVLVETDPDRTVVVNTAEAVADDGASARAGTVQPYSTDRGLDLTPGTRLAAAPGATVGYPHTVTNTGDLADEVSVSGASASGFPTWVVLDADGDGTADADEPDLVDALALAPGESADLVVVVEVPADAPVGLVDDLVVTAASLAETGIAVTATNVTAVVAPVLRVVKASQPNTTIEPGSVVRFGIAVTNTGSEPARDVVVTDPIPAGTTYVAGSTQLDGVTLADVGERSPIEPTASGVAMGDLEPGASRTVVFSVTVSTDVIPGAILTNVADVTSASTGTVPSSPVALTVVGASDLDVTKVASPAGAVAPGGNVRWTITVTNAGTIRVDDVLVTDQLSPALAYVTGSTTLDGTTVGDGITAGTPVTIGGLEPGQARTIVFDTTVGQVADGTVIQNAATVANGVTGTAVLSNAATVTVEVLADGLPATGWAAGRTLAIAVTALVTGWALLYVARPERRPRPVLARRSR